MEQTSHLSLPFILPSQAQKHVTHNEALRLLDAIVQLAVKGRNSGSAAQDPAGGDRHIVGANASGDWAGHEHDVALFDGAGWMFLPPAQGWIAFVEDEDDFVTFRDGAWEPLEKGTNPVALLGVNTLADQTNKLAVKSDVVLHSHDDVTPGTGDARHVLNKAGPLSTASVVYQSGWSGRAETGLAGGFRQHVDLVDTAEAQNVQVLRRPAEHRDRFDGRDAHRIVAPGAAIEKPDIIHRLVAREISRSG